MLKQLLVGLLLCQSFALATSSAYAGSGGTGGIRMMRAQALQESARGEIEAALKTYDSVIRMAENEYGSDSTYVSDICFEAGVTALRSDRYEKARSCLSKAVQINPNSTEARLKLAEYFKIKGMYRQARKEIVTVLQADRRNLAAQELLAMTYQKEGNVAQATEECRILAKMASGKGGEVIARRAPSIVAAPSAPSPPTVAVVAAAPAPVAAPVPPSGLGGIRRTATVTPVPATPVKPEAAAPKKAEPKPAKAAESVKKPEKKAEKKNKPKPKPQQETIATASAFNSPVRLQSKAVLLTPVKKAKPEVEKPEAPVKTAVKKDDPKDLKTVETKPAEDESSEVGFGGSTPAKSAASAAKPASKAQPVVVKTRIEAPKPRRGLVPPPPPVVPTFMIAPPPPANIPPPPKPVARPKPVEKPKETAAPVKENVTPTDEDTDFLLDWAGKKKGK